MAINTGYIINGTIGNICGYMSRGGRNIIRKKSSLTGARVKNDRAFQGFRESGNRMKDASPIASFLYGLLPKEDRHYPLYRRLTGEALNMLKQGMDGKLITDTLHALYIQPLLASPEQAAKPNNTDHQTAEQRTTKLHSRKPQPAKSQKKKLQPAKPQTSKRAGKKAPILTYMSIYAIHPPPHEYRKFMRTSRRIRGRPIHDMLS